MYIFERIDILVLPSISKDGLPNVLLEAMSMNVPVIYSEMAGVPEIVKDCKTGYMVKPGKAASLQRQLQNCGRIRQHIKK